MRIERDVVRAVLLAGALLLGFIGIAYGVDTGLRSSGGPQGDPSGTVVSPMRPFALAVGPSGSLYLVDAGRDQILRLLRDGRFLVVAGTGRRGFSGDGAPAVDAEIHLDAHAGIAVGRDGTVYFSDDWNGRVRAVLPDGVIETVAGGGHTPLRTRPVRALAASFGAPFSLSGLAIGPGGQLYIGTSAVYRLAPDGRLHWVVGEPVQPRRLPKGWGGVYSNPAIESDFSPAVRIAFDGRGDLLVAGGGAWGLYEDSCSGALRFVGNDREPGGFWGSIASGRSGAVITAGSFGLARFHPSGRVTPIVARDLSSILGPHQWFLTGAGAAVAPDGTLYLSDDSGSGYPTSSSLVSVSPSGRVRLIWKA